MYSKFYFSYATSFFLVLFFASYSARESGMILGLTLFALCFSVFYNAVEIVTTINESVKLIIGLIDVALAWYILWLLTPDYILWLFGAFAPILIASFIEDRIGYRDFKIVMISLIEVFGICSAILALITLIFNHIDFPYGEIPFLGADDATLAGSLLLSGGSVGLLMNYMKKQKWWKKNN